MKLFTSKDFIHFSNNCLVSIAISIWNFKKFSYIFAAACLQASSFQNTYQERLRVMAR